MLYEVITPGPAGREGSWARSAATIGLGSTHAVDELGNERAHSLVRLTAYSLYLTIGVGERFRLPHPATLLV